MLLAIPMSGGTIWFCSQLNSNWHYLLESSKTQIDSRSSSVIEDCISNADCDTATRCATANGGFPAL
jgi:hypothetical protein